MILMRLYNNFSSHLPKEIKECLHQTVSRITSFKSGDFLIEELFRPSTHLLNKGGKLLRPTLLFLGAAAIDENGKNLIDLAAAIELLHVSSLIHDDIIDKGEVRRGVGTVNKKYGDNIALLAGNALISKAIHLSSKYGREVMDAVSSTALQMSAGELLDYQSKMKGNGTDMDEYLEIAKLKTAALTGTSCNIAAVYKKSSAKAALYKYGFNLGIAFQIRDDMIDFMEPNHVRSGTNIVTLIKKKYNTNKDRALEKAAKLNHYYIQEALSKIEGGRMEILKPYAKMIEVG